jgi:hypothetical protein
VQEETVSHDHEPDHPHARRHDRSHDSKDVMLDALLAIPVPTGWTIARRDRHDAVIVHTFRDVTISPPGVDVSTFRFGTAGAYANIHVNHGTNHGVDHGADHDGNRTYIVGVYATDVAYHVQRAGHVVHFATAADAVQCALDELRGELRRQERGW